MKMKIEHTNALILCDSLPGAMTSCAQMIKDIEVELKARGANVTVAGIGGEDHVEAHPLSIYSRQLKSPRLIVRAASECLASVRLGIKLHVMMLRGKLVRPTLIIVYQPSLFLTLTAALIRLHPTRSQLLVVQRDIVPDWLIASGRIQPGVATWALSKLKDFSLKSADWVGIECAENNAYVPDRFRHKTFVLNNWRNFESHAVHDTDSTNTAQTTFIYGGRVGVAQGFDRFLQAFCDADMPAVSLKIYCDERGKQEIAAVALTESQRSRVLVNDMVVETEFLESARQATFGVITLAPELRTHNIPGKLLAYLAAGIPVFVIAPRDSALRRIITELDCGVSCAAENPAEILETLRLVLNDGGQRRKHCAQNIPTARRYFDVKLAADAIEQRLQSPA